MNIDDLIAGFQELERQAPWARFTWNTVGRIDTIYVSGGGSVFQALLNDGGALVLPTRDNPGKTAAERFIVEVFRRAPEMSEGGGGALGHISRGWVDGKPVEVASRSVQYAARAAVVALRRMKADIVKQPAATSAADPHIQRLQWRLNEMIQILETTPVEYALGSIAHCEDEAAELIERTGLTDELQFPSELRPVFKREHVDIDEDGFGKTVVYSFRGPDGHCCTASFDWFAASTSEHMGEAENEPGFTTVWKREVPEHRKPNPQFIKDLIKCVRGWREYTNAPRLPKPAALHPLAQAAEKPVLVIEVPETPSALASFLQPVKLVDAAEIIGERSDEIGRTLKAAKCKYAVVNRKAYGEHEDLCKLFPKYRKHHQKDRD